LVADHQRRSPMRRNHLPRVGRSTRAEETETGSGFTVLEVLIALTILAMAMSVLLAVFSQGLDRAHASTLRIRARDLAESLLARAETAPPGTLANAQGRSGFLMWQVNLSPFGSPEDQQAWQFAPVTLAVTVRWQDHGRWNSLSVSTLRLMQKKADS
jgi:general secretion pathway protein I